MAEATASTDIAKLDEPANFLPGINQLGLFKQIGLMVGIAASVALGMFLVLWGSEPDMRPLGVTDAETTVDVVSYLEQNNITYRLDQNGGVSVPQSEFQKIKLGLASQGTQLGQGQSDFYLNQESGFGVSQRMEQARLQRSQEMLLAKTISDFSGIRSAKVHLALPPQSAFLKHKRKPSASVLLNLYSQRQLESEQVRAIVDLVTGSVPNLESNRVTVTDQLGRLLHSGSQTAEELDTTRDLKITRERQAEYQAKVEQILLPIVGDGNFAVQVNVDMDFTKTEQTQQVYNPELPSLRSERTMEDESGTLASRGVPGALSNQPPAAAQIPETLGGGAGGNQEQNTAKNRRIEAERNYDLDTTISHIKQQVGVIETVSVSVGLDYVADVTDPTLSVPRPADQVANITRLIQGAIGYNVRRGDRVEVESFQFVRPEALPDPEPLPFYELPLFQALWKPVTALLLGIMLIFAVLKPVMKKLTTPVVMPQAVPDTSELELADLEDDQLSIGEEAQLQLPGPDLAGSVKSEQAKHVVGQDPTMVAQLVKSWVEQDE